MGVDMARVPEGAVRRAMAARARHPVGDLLGEVAQVVEVEVDRVLPNPRQPRRTLDPAAVTELAASIEAHGLLQPIVVRPAGDGYELIAGSRRLAAHGRLGRARITAIVVRTGDPEAMALVENLQREALSAVDEAEALAALKERHGCTLEALQRLVGRSVPHLSEIMSVRHLPPAILEEARALAAEGRPPPRAGLVELVRIKDPRAQATAWAVLRDGGGRAGVRAARRPAANGERSAAGGQGGLLRDAGRLRARLRAAGPLDTETRAALEALRRAIDARLA